ncbi:pantoate--beta-alanine ligase [Schaalia sp. Marseille-Q2122]|uniref:pantoate--beta-alanine ligase n=1 Tax=Schaalia sp. Marseille-Q2122 TaxID=2736604 RepID=UPI00158DA380|nr:pantoate--beta-alanine ligase [Schaalia sp. Marseille-Q2122]
MTSGNAKNHHHAAAPTNASPSAARQRPHVVHSRADYLSALTELPGSVGLVMTMGALHDGHLELVRQAHTHADHVVVTIFVNPTQFAPGEDFDAYPRTLEADIAALTTVGADLVWAPAPEDVYPEAPLITLDPGPVGHHLEGASRPTHFAGVALVVTKVLNLTRPKVALFGEKDAQQLAVIRAFVRDLDMPVEIVGVPIVRDTDGVALSSRNQYLSPEERTRARALNRALTVGAEAAAVGAAPTLVIAAARQVLDAEGGVDIDYVELVDDHSFQPLNAGSARGRVQARLLIAARVGTTRLIDNMAMTVEVRG